MTKITLETVVTLNLAEKSTCCVRIRFEFVTSSLHSFCVSHVEITSPDETAVAVLSDAPSLLEVFSITAGWILASAAKNERSGIHPYNYRAG